MYSDSDNYKGVEIEFSLITNLDDSYFEDLQKGSFLTLRLAGYFSGNNFIDVLYKGIAIGRIDDSELQHSLRMSIVIGSLRHIIFLRKSKDEDNNPTVKVKLYLVNYNGRSQLPDPKENDFEFLELKSLREVKHPFQVTILHSVMMVTYSHVELYLKGIPLKDIATDMPYETLGQFHEDEKFLEDFALRYNCGMIDDEDDIKEFFKTCKDNRNWGNNTILRKRVKIFMTHFDKYKEEKNKLEKIINDDASEIRVIFDSDKEDLSNKRRETLNRLNAQKEAYLKNANTNENNSNNDSDQKYSVMDLSVRGTSFLKKEQILRLVNIRKDNVCTLRREINNPKDKNAVAVYFLSYKIGYLPAEHAEFVSDILSKDDNPNYAMVIKQYGGYLKGEYGDDDDDYDDDDYDDDEYDDDELFEDGSLDDEEEENDKDRIITEEDLVGGFDDDGTFNGPRPVVVLNFYYKDPNGEHDLSEVRDHMIYTPIGKFKKDFDACNKDDFYNDEFNLQNAYIYPQLYKSDIPDKESLIEEDNNWLRCFSEKNGRGHLTSKKDLQEFLNKVEHERKIGNNDVFIKRLKHYVIDANINLEEDCMSMLESL